MMKWIASVSLLISSHFAFSQTESFHDFYGKTILGQHLDFSVFRGKKVMVVNTASYCGWTYQYETLEELYQQYKDSNFTILGFPCNDFSNQEPGSDSSINEFCSQVYNIQFQMMSKVAIVSHDTDEVYKWLQRGDRNGVADAHVSWNFNKFLIDEAGHWVAHYTNLTEPFDTAIINWILSPSVLPPDTVSSFTGRGVEPQLVFSSPISGTLKLSFQGFSSSEAVVGIFSPEGQMLRKVFDGRALPGDELTIDVSPLPNSIYFLRVQTAAGDKIFRFAVIK